MRIRHFLILFAVAFTGCGGQDNGITTILDGNTGIIGTPGNNTGIPNPSNGNGDGKNNDDSTATKIHLSGNVAPPANLLVDVDTGQSTDSRNDSGLAYNVAPVLSLAQDVPPSTNIVTGYLESENGPIYGPSGDVLDFYVLSDVKAGQVLSVNSKGDAMTTLVTLWDIDGIEIVQFVAGLDSVTNLTVTAPGDYIVGIQVTKGYGNYIFYPDAHEASGMSVTLASSESDFRNDHILAIDKVSIDAAKTRVHKVAINDIAQTNSIEQPFSAYDTYIPSSLKDKWAVTKAIITYNAAEDSVRFEPDFIYRSFDATHSTPNDTNFDALWGLTSIHSQQAWDYTDGSVADDPVIVAVVDSGIFPNHPDIQGALIQGYDVISSAEEAGDGDGYDSDPTPDSTQEGATHGLHVTGTIAATAFNNMGIAGIAPGVKIMPVRAIGSDSSGSSLDIATGILYAAGLPNDTGLIPEKRADIINLSLGGTSNSTAVRLAVEDAINAGVIVVAANGNSGNDIPMYPAALDRVIGVSAYNKNKELAYYSNYGDTTDISAPGGGTTGGILSLNATNTEGSIEYGYSYRIGTSMATPHVSGALALLIAEARLHGQSLTLDEIEGLLSAGYLTDDIGDPGLDTQFGWGALNVGKAMVHLATDFNDVYTPPEMATYTHSINFRSFLKERIVRFTNIGGGDLEITGYTKNNPWLEIDEVTGQPYTYKISVDRNKMPNLGPHLGAFTVRSNGGDITIQIAAEKTLAELVSDNGYYRVALIDSDGIELGSIETSLMNNGYAFDFILSNPNGAYSLRAAKDLNGNGIYCESGEICGESEQPLSLIEKDWTGITISVSLSN